jgi:hypothetical protein
MKTLQAKIAIALFTAMLTYLKENPAVLDKLMGQIAELIPGKWDDAALHTLAKVMKAMGL